MTIEMFKDWIEQIRDALENNFTTPSAMARGMLDALEAMDLFFMLDGTTLEGIRDGFCPMMLNAKIDNELTSEMKQYVTGYRGMLQDIMTVLGE